MRDVRNVNLNFKGCSWGGEERGMYRAEMAGLGAGFEEESRSASLHSSESRPVRPISSSRLCAVSHANTPHCLTPMSLTPPRSQN